MRAEVAAVGYHDSHSERERVEALADGGEYSFRAHLREVGQQIEAKPRFRARQRDGAYDENKYYDEERRHEHLAALLYASADSAVGYADDGGHDDYEAEYGQHRVGDEGDERVCGSSGNSRLLHEPAEGLEHICDRPSGYDGVVGKYDEGAEEAEPADERPRAAAELLERADGVEARLAPYRELCEHYRRADENDEKQIDDDERAAAVFSRDVREAPDVSETYRGTCGGHDKAELTPPLIPFA